MSVFAPRAFGRHRDRRCAARAPSRDRQLARRRPLALQRVVDFTSGVAYTIDGRIQKLAEAIYLVVPAGVTVNSAGLREPMNDDGMLDFKARHGTIANDAMKNHAVDIQHKTFKQALQGYDRTEVDEFLDEIIETLEDEARRAPRSKPRSPT